MQVGNDIESLMRRVTLLMQEHGNYYSRQTRQNTIDYKILHRIVVPLEYQDSINFDKNYTIFSGIRSNPEFALEMERLISRNELSLEYTKSVQHVLIWLNKLFGIKWQQLHDDFDYVSRWKLLDLQRQAVVLLENFFADNLRQHGKPKNYNYILKDRSNSILNTGKIQVEGTTLFEQNKKNVNKTETDKDKSWKIRSSDKFEKNTSSDYTTSKIETRIMNNLELLKRIKNNNKDKSYTNKIPNDHKTSNTSIDDKDNSIINNTFFSKLKLRDKNLIKHGTSSKLKKIISTLHDKHMKDHGKQFSQLKNLSSIFPSENIITSQETDQLKHNRTSTMLHGFLKENITDIPKTPLRRTLHVFVPSNKNEDQKKKDRHASTEKSASKYDYFNERKEIRIDSASAMDEILEAVDEVLPTDKSVDMMSKTISGIL